MIRGFIVPQTGPQSGGRISVGNGIVLGRTNDCGYVIEDAAASRRHVEIKFEDGSFQWRDLDSTNGTMVNGVRQSGGELQHGDKIQVGETVIAFVIERDEQDAAASSTLFRHAILNERGEATRAPHPTDPLLEAAYTVMNDLASDYDACRLADRILTTTMKAINAQRGAIYFRGATEEALQPCPACGYLHAIKNGEIFHTDTSEFRISSTVAKHVLEHGESVLYEDAKVAGDLQSAKSVAVLGLRSIICAPIRGKFGVLGILYIDTDQPRRKYSRDHMLLASAVGNSAGLALENARLHQEILDKQRIEHELEFAAIIQEGLLVRRWPDTDPRYEVFGDARPAKTVGGDFYDFVVLDEDHVAIVIGDVSGKGVPAALAMAQLLSEFRVRALQEKSPARVLERMNAEFVERSRRGMFCTMCYLAVDLSRRHVVCANAGHHAPLCITPRGVREFAAASGPPVGVVRQAAYTDAETEFSPGDTLLLYTDGVTEARSAATYHEGNLHQKPEEYSLENLMKLVKHLAVETPQVLVTELIKDVHRFCEPDAPHDDCTVIALRHNGP